MLTVPCNSLMRRKGVMKKWLYSALKRIRTIQSCQMSI